MSLPIVVGILATRPAIRCCLRIFRYVGHDSVFSEVEEAVDADRL